MLDDRWLHVCVRIWIAQSHLWQGVIYSQRGEKQKAMDDLKAALKGLDDPTLKQRAEEELRKLK